MGSSGLSFTIYEWEISYPYSGYLVDPNSNFIWRVLECLFKPLLSFSKDVLPFIPPDKKLVSSVCVLSKWLSSPAKAEQAGWTPCLSWTNHSLSSRMLELWFRIVIWDDSFICAGGLQPPGTHGATLCFLSQLRSPHIKQAETEDGVEVPRRARTRGCAGPGFLQAFQTFVLGFFL